MPQITHFFATDYRYLTSYHECDSVTPEEKNICSNINKVFFCGVYSPKIFSDYGISVDSFNLGFDSNSFYKTNKTYFNDNINIENDEREETYKKVNKSKPDYKPLFGKLNISKKG